MGDSEKKQISKQRLELTRRNFGKKEFLMMKLQLSVITIIFLCIMTLISSTSKDHEVGGKKNTQSMEELLSLNHNEQDLQDQQDTFEKKREKTSQYKGVIWSKRIEKWYVLIRLKGQKRKYGGIFKDELDAAKGVNQLCEELGIPLKNPEVSAIPNQPYQIKEMKSRYKGVSWHKKTRKWRVQLSIKGEKQKAGGYFHDELEAGKKVNQLCEEFGIPLRNPEISTIPNQQYQKNCKILLDYDLIKVEFQRLIKIIDENNDPTTHIIKKKPDCCNKL